MYCFVQKTLFFTAASRLFPQKAKEVSIKGIHALGLRNSIAHIELIQKEGEWKIVEIGARMGGFRSMMYKKSFGINLDIQDINIHLGRKINLPRNKKGYTSVIKFFAKKEGIITKIQGIKKTNPGELKSKFAVVKIPANKKVNSPLKKSRRIKK